MTEFELIQAYFSSLGPASESVILGVGDDAALWRPRADHDVVVCTDTLVSGRHFPEQTAAADIGWKALAVNLSDLAAMGAQAKAFVLALTLPQASEVWLSDFAQGLAALAQQQGARLIGGDTTRGPLSVTITALGEVPRDGAVQRSGARPGDCVVVSGCLGDAAASLQQIQQSLTLAPDLLARLNRPQPRSELGIALRGRASACIDVSDGLAADLGHLLDASGVGAQLDVGLLPASATLEQAFDLDQRHAFQLAGGDDYELCFTASEADLIALRRDSSVPLTVIGQITAQTGLRIQAANGATMSLPEAGYRHF